MTADQFVNTLAHSAPSAESLVAKGWPERAAVRAARARTVLPSGTTSGSRQDDPLLDLLTRFDTSHLDIGAVTLNPQAMTHIDTSELEARNKTLVGADESHPLVLDRQTGEIQLLDVGDYGRVMLRFARSSSEFLAALLLVAQYTPPHIGAGPGLRLTDDEAAANQRAAVEYAEKCAQAAGLLPTERNVYRDMLGLVH